MSFIKEEYKEQIMNEEFDTSEEPISNKRAARRRQKISKQKKVENMVRNIWNNKNPSLLQDMIHNCDNVKICGKDCCKNPRRSGWSKAKGKTRKELQNDISEYKSLSESE